MASWAAFAVSTPEFAAAVRAIFDAHRHKLLATLRRDGSPRISGIELEIAEGDLWLGMMPGSRKALDLRRDPRLALHSAAVDVADDPTGWPGDAKLSGRAEEISDPEWRAALASGDGQPGQLFRVEIDEVVLTRVGDPPDHLVIEVWREGQGLRRIERR